MIDTKIIVQIIYINYEFMKVDVAGCSQETDFVCNMPRDQISSYAIGFSS